MALPREMEEHERKVFALHGAFGFIPALLLLLIIWVTLTYYGIKVQQENATKYYIINQDLNGIKAGSIFSNGDQKDGTKNVSMRQNVKD